MDVVVLAVDGPGVDPSSAEQATGNRNRNRNRNLIEFVSRR